jgi:hypothetical protein
MTVKELVKERAMKKIGCVIETCNECQYLRVFKCEEFSLDFLDVCVHNPNSKKVKVIILDKRCGRDVRRIEIPEECPLENYPNY